MIYNILVEFPNGFWLFGLTEEVTSVKKVLVEKLFSFKDTVVIALKFSWQVFGKRVF